MSSRRETLWAISQNLEPEDRENQQNHEFLQAEESGFPSFVCLTLPDCLVHQFATFLQCCINTVTRVRMTSHFHSNRDFGMKIC